jgi:amino acid permease
MSLLQHHLTTVERGALGTFASIGSAAVSMVSQLEVYLRIAGLLVGLAVGIVTLLSVLHDLRNKQKLTKQTKE